MASSKKSGKNSRKSSPESKDRAKKENFLRDEIIILLSLAICIFLTISHFGIGGYVGDKLSSILFGIFGFPAYFFPVLMFTGISFILSNKGNPQAYLKAGAVFFLFLMCCTLFQLIINGYNPDKGWKEIYRLSSVHRDGGGVCGGFLTNLLTPAIGIAGTYVIVIILCIISFVILTGKSFIEAVKDGSGRVYRSAKEDAAARRKERVCRDEEDDISGRDEKKEGIKEKRLDKVVSGVSYNTTIEKEADNLHDVHDIHEIKSPVDDISSVLGDERQDVPKISRAETGINDGKHGIDGKEGGENDEAVPGVPQALNSTRKRQGAISGNSGAGEDASLVGNGKEDALANVLPDNDVTEKQKKAYVLPPLSLLKKGKGGGGDSDSHLRETARKLEQTLANFNVGVTVTNVSCGPSVTRYELQPEQGVKVSKIVGLSDDIKLNLAAADIRIEAPIPGKAAVGIEVPNKENVAVMLRDLLESVEFTRHPSKIAFAVGRDIAGKVVVADIAKMPHLLIAGATGSGKSVCINTLIMSILYKADPSEVRLMMIDPKVVELKVYNGIPHLLIPVVTDPKKAAGALNWAVAEMGRRYQLFAEYNVRDLKGYNAKVDALGDIEDKPEKLPQIVIIVDELADLMMVAPGEVEDAICRLAQLARACGIHLVVATQRPSVNVITGLIKANMPSRIAFEVASGVDSRTIIDMNGAEKLLGKGDMLFYPAGYPKPARVQGSFVSDQEVQAVTDFLKKDNNSVLYSEEITKHMDAANQAATAVSDTGADERDVYFAEAGRFIIEKEKASIGMLQRVFKIGFNRAARIMDQLAEAGVVGEEEGTKPRKLLMTMEEFEQYLEEYV